MIKLTKLCNKRRIEEERTSPENDFGLCVVCLSHRLCLTSCANYSKSEKGTWCYQNDFGSRFSAIACLSHRLC